MADSVNRIVPSPGTIDRVNYQKREGQKKKDPKTNGSTHPPAFEPVAPNSADDIARAPDSSKADKGNNLDVNA